MKLFTPWIFACLTCLTTTPNKASVTIKQYPEAYAGLNKSAYHHISLNKNKSNGFSFKLDGIKLFVQLDKLKPVVHLGDFNFQVVNMSVFQVINPLNNSQGSKFSQYS